MKKKPTSKKHAPLHDEHPCKGCMAECCQYIAVIMAEPKDMSDFELIKWYLDHKKVTVYIDENMEWFVHIEVPCRHIGSHGECKIYGRRSQICREYGTHECERYDTSCDNIAEFEDTKAFERFFALNYDIIGKKCRRKNKKLVAVKT